MMSESMDIGTEDVATVSAADISDVSEMSDVVTVELNPEPSWGTPEGHKGPDPEVWGAHEDRYAADVEAGKAPDPIVDGIEVKGPDPAVWSNY